MELGYLLYAQGFHYGRRGQEFAKVSPFTLYASNANISGVKQIFQWSLNYKFRVQVFSISAHVNNKLLCSNWMKM